MTGFPKSISFDTALGRFDFSASVQPAVSSAKTRVNLEERYPDLDLPHEMSVERCRAVVLSVVPSSPLLSLRFECHFRGHLHGSRCSGEGLDAFEWGDDSHLVVVGTEDSDFLISRMPFLDGLDEWVGDFSNNTMTITLENIDTGGKELTLHFILAENPEPEPVDASAWFAVDCPHARLRPR